jgi:hypothetical protein
MENNNILFEKLAAKYPFLTVCRYADEEHVGIIQNRDGIITSLYDFGSLPTLQHKELFLLLGESWWWESNRSIPINIFLRSDWDVFKPYTKTFTNKTLEILSGPCTSLSEIAHKKRKRRSITLVRKVD